MPEIPYFTGLYEGRGINPDTGKTFNVGITFDPLQPLLPTKKPQSDKEQPTQEGQQSEFTLTVITESSQMASSLNVSATASVTAKMGNLSVEGKFLLERSVNSYYTYSLAKVIVTNPGLTIRNPLLKKDAQELLAKSGWDEFSQRYGLSYIEGIITGGIYYALIEVQTTSAEEQREIGAKLSGSYKGFGVKGDAAAQVESKVRQATGNHKTNVYIFQAGGSGDILETSIEEMIDQAKNFPNLVKKAPVPTKAIINDYRSSVANIPLTIPKQSLKLSEQKIYWKT